MKPMLGTTATRDELIARLAQGPLLASYKLDGIRALIINGVVMSRSLKPIPNPHVQELFGRPEYEGLDGELIVGSVTAPDVFRVTTSGVMSQTGVPDVRYHVFDQWNSNLSFGLRSLVNLAPLTAGTRIVPVVQCSVDSIKEVDSLAALAYGLGYEGLVLRDPAGLYKHGRSTVKEAGLLKIKPFVDAEAVVIGIVEQMHNANEAFKDELGHTKRSTAKAGKVGMKTLGALVCRTPEGVEFEIGTGFSAAEREAFWMDLGIIGRLVKYKSLNVGVKDKPRHAVFLGFRDRRDT